VAFLVLLLFCKDHQRHPWEPQKETHDLVGDSVIINRKRATGRGGDDVFDVDVGVLSRACTDHHDGPVQRLQGIGITVCEVVADVHVNYRCK
jgi:hypothetical protein